MVSRSPTTESGELHDELLGQAAEEYFAAAAAGWKPAISEFAQRYPAIADEIRVVFPALALVGDSMASESSGGASARFNAPQQLGDFRLIREIGRGGMGIVFAAEQVSVGRRVALKVLPFASLASETALKRFQNEIRTAASLEHSNIVSVFASGEERGVHFFAMQLIRGRSLAELAAELRLTVEFTAAGSTAGQGSAAKEECLVETASFSQLSTDHASDRRGYFRRLAELALQACDALQYAHEMGVVHRDVKPSNLMLDENGRVWLTDFGLAVGQASGGLTMTGDLVGTLRYMSPEQALGKAVIDHRTDVYSLGATLYELATLQPSFQDNDRQKLLRMIAEQEPPAPRSHDSTIPQDFETIIRKSMEKDPVDRYATARELADDLQRFVADKPIYARPPSLAYHLNKWSRRHRKLFWLAAALLCATTVGLGWTALVINRARNEALVAKDDAIVERDRAENNLQLALEAIDNLYTQFSSDRLALEPKLTKVRREFLQQALAFYQRFAAQNKLNVAAWPEVGRLYLTIGNIHQELEELQAAALAYYKSAEIFNELQFRHPEEITHAAQLAIVAGEVGNVAERLGAPEMAIPMFYQAAMTLEDLGPPIDAKNISTETNRASLLATCYVQLGNSMTSAGKGSDAEESYRRALSLLRRLVKLEPENADTLESLGGALHDFALLRESQHNGAEAQRLLEEAITMSRRAVAASPDHPGHRRFLRNHYAILGTLLFDQGALVPAIEKFQEACVMADALAADFPDVAKDQDWAAMARFSWACASSARGKPAEAADRFRECSARWGRLTLETQESSTRPLYRAMAQLGVALTLADANATEADRLRSTALRELRGLAREAKSMSVDDLNLNNPLSHAAAIVEMTSELEATRAASQRGDAAEAQRRAALAGAAVLKLRNSVTVPASDPLMREFARMHEAALTHIKGRLEKQVVAP